MGHDLNATGFPYFEYDLSDDDALHGEDTYATQVDNGCSSGNATVHFKNLATALIRYIEKSEVVVGCVAWLTHRSILNALAKKKGVSVVVQKEDFLRPDSDVVRGSDWARILRTSYESLRSVHSKNIWHEFSNGLYLHGDIDIDPVRCMGFRPDRSLPAQPRMHHKFLVFCSQGGWGYDPYAVWTGSFNLTHNGTNSLENAVYLNDVGIASAYLREWAQVLALSEPLDWTSQWVEPNYDVTNIQTWSKT